MMRVRFGWPRVLHQRDGSMPRKIFATYKPGADEAGFAFALVCFLLSIAPPIIALLVPASFEELTRVDGLHRICSVCSACFSFCVLLVGYGFNRLRSVMLCNIAGSTLLVIAFLIGSTCCSGLIAWIQGHVSMGELPEGTLLTAALSPFGSLFLMLGHSLNLRWWRQVHSKFNAKRST